MRVVPPASFRRTDYGNAERLVHRHGSDLLHLRGQWYVWDGTRFKIDMTGAVDRLAKETVRSIWDEAKQTAEAEDPGAAKQLGVHAADSESRSRLAAMVALAATELPVIVEEADSLDGNPWALNCANGTIDLHTGQLRAHDRADRITRTTGIEADMAAEAPCWDAFLTRILPDPQVRDFVQRVVGYTLTGLTSEEKLIFLNGGGANGKSTLIDAIMMILGEYAMPAPPDLLLSKRPGAPTNDIAALRGARLASAAETEDGARLDEVRTKSLVTGDAQSARFLHKEFFTFRPVAKYLIATNHRPIVRGSDEAIWRRMILIPFTAFIPPEDRDKGLADKLRAEAPGILAWAVRGCLAWQQRGLTEPTAICEATAGYRAEQDLIGGFLEDACVLHERAHTGATALYRAYVSWCEETGENAQTQRRFGQRLSERPGLYKAKSGTVEWYGVGLRSGGTWDHLGEPSTSTPPRPAPAPAPPAVPPEPAAAAPAPTPAPAGACEVCRAPSAMWCGFGWVEETEELPCVACEVPTRIRARCGAARHAHPGSAAPEPQTPPPPPAPAPRPDRPARSVSAKGGAELAAPRIDPAEELKHFAVEVRKHGYPEATDADLVTALDVFHEETGGLRFVSYAAETGVAAYAWLVAKHGSMPLPEPVSPTGVLKEASDALALFRDYLVPGLDLPAEGWVTSTDVNFQFVGAARSVELGDGEATLVDKPMSAAPLLRLPGYLELARPVNTGHPAFGRLAKGTWLTTQTATYLTRNRGVELPAARALVWHKHGRRLSVWAKLFGGAYQALKPRDDLPGRYALAGVKAVATAFLGGMLRSAKFNRTTLLRPDWSDQVITLAGANMLRALDKVGPEHMLVGIWRDAAWWASPDPAPVALAALEFSRQPGKWKVDRHAPITEEMRAAYAAGSAVAFRDGLIASLKDES